MTPEVRRNAFLLCGGLICNSGMFQLAAALSSLTLVAVTGVSGILGLGPAIFLAAGGAAVGPAGRLMDRVGRMPVIRGSFVSGAVGCAVVSAGCRLTSAALVALGLALVGASAAVVQLSRAAAAEMFPPERRARGISFVLFGAVSGAIWGPVLFGPLFGDRAAEAHALAWPWLLGVPFMVAGFAISSRVRRDPKEIARLHPGERDDDGPPAPLRTIVARPGVPAALLAAVASFAVMAGVMNLAGYVAVGRGHHESDVFTMISVHIVGMYGLVLVVGDLIDRFGRRRRARRRAARDGRVERGADVVDGRRRHEPRAARARPRLELLLRRRHDRAGRVLDPVGAGPPRRLLRPRLELGRRRARPRRRRRLQRRGRDGARARRGRGRGAAGALARRPPRAGVPAGALARGRVAAAVFGYNPPPADDRVRLFSL